MIELGQLERRHEDFARRNARVIVVSVEGPEDAKKTQAEFPHLLVIADEQRGLSDAVELIHPHAAPDGKDAATPTTILVGPNGTVRWLYRSSQVIARLAPDEVLQAIDLHVPTKQASPQRQQGQPLLALRAGQKVRGSEGQPQAARRMNS